LVRASALKDIIDFSVPYDKDNVLRHIPSSHLQRLNQYNEIAVTGYRRTRHGKQSLELRFDGIAGCLRTPEGGSSKQFLIVKHDGELHARLLTPRETARLMGAPDTYILPDIYNDAYKAMGVAVVLPVAAFIGQSFLVRLAEVIYYEQYRKTS
jgi:DNA (cytosine-5)-methyltransferase 1